MRNIDKTKHHTKKRKGRKFFKLLITLIFILAAFHILHINVNSIFNLILNNENACATTDPSPYEDPYKNVPLHNYNWDNLFNNGDRLEYYEAKGYEALQGIDISKYQGDVDWNKVKNSGIDFAMLRVGYRGYSNGQIAIDEKFIDNIRQSTNANVQVGGYFFSQAITEQEAVEEADFVLQNIRGYNIDFPIVFDLEEISAADHRTHLLTKEERTKIAIAFCERIKEAGYTPMVYGNVSWLKDYYDLTQIIQYDIWLAQYSDCPSFPYDFQMWQYTNSGYVDGINHIVDINLCFKEY